MFRILVCTTTFPFLVACGEKTEPAPTGDKAPAAAESAPAAEEPAEKPAANSAFPGFDSTVELALLNGKWAVKTSLGQKEPAIWTVKDGAVTMVEGEKTVEGKLGVDYPGRIKVMTSENGGESTSYYSYTHDGETIYLGLGAGGLKIGEVYYGADAKGVAVFDGTKCQFHGSKMTFGAEAAKFEAPKDITCAVEGTNFKYQVPKFGEEGAFNDKTLEIVGTALLSSQLKQNTISKAE